MAPESETERHDFKASANVSTNPCQNSTVASNAATITKSGRVIKLSNKGLILSAARERKNKRQNAAARSRTPPPVQTVAVPPPDSVTHGSGKKPTAPRKTKGDTFNILARISQFAS